VHEFESAARIGISTFKSAYTAQSHIEVALRILARHQAILDWPDRTPATLHLPNYVNT